MKLYPIFIRQEDPTVAFKRIVTQCFLITEDKNVVAFGQSFKRPLDNFDRKKGLKIALGRALKAYQTGFCRVTRWSDLPKAGRVGGYSTFPFQAIPNNVIEKIRLDKKDAIEILSDEEREFNSKFEGFTNA